MLLRSTITASALMLISTAACAQANVALFVPSTGMQFTTAFTNEFGKDAESITTVTGVNENSVSINYSSSRGVSVKRDLRATDRLNATSYVLGYEDGMPTVIPGTTSLGVSANILSQLRTSGSARLTLIYSPQLASIECNLVRVAANENKNVIVGDQIVTLTTLHARAECGEGSRTASGDFYFADDIAQPILIESNINFSWESRPRTERITRVIDTLGLNPDMERSLRTIGKYDAYGLRFDFDSAQMRDESTQLVREIARMLTVKENSDWLIKIVGHTDSTGGPDYNIDLSDQRAQAVRTALLREGIDPRRLISEGRGETQSKSDNTTLAGRAINRRVEFKRLDGPGSRPLDAQ